MARFINFVLRRWLVAGLIALTAMSGALGYAQQGAQIWAYGPPGWALQIFAFLLFIGVVTVLIFEWEETLLGAALSARPSAADAAAESDRRKERAVLMEIQTTIETVEWGATHSDAQHVAADFAVLKSTFTTLRKTYQIEPPVLAEPNEKSLRIGAEFLRQIMPFLSAGHVEEARMTAERYLRGEPA